MARRRIHGLNLGDSRYSNWAVAHLSSGTDPAYPTRSGDYVIPRTRPASSHFGEFGKQGTGYQISHLQAQLKQILQVNREWPLVVVGAGDLGRAIAHYGGFVERGFRVVGLFDNDPAKIGTGAPDLKVKDIAEITDFVRERNIKIAMIAVPAEHAQAVCDTLVKAGVRAILNYAPITLTVPEGVHVQYIDPVTHLQRMTYYLD